MTSTLKLALTGFFVFLLTLSAASTAHEIRPAIIDLTLEEDGAYRIDIQTSVETYLAGIGPEVTDTNDAPQADEYDRYRAMSAQELTPVFKEFVPELINGIRFQADGIDLNLPEPSLALTNEPDLELARDAVITFTGTLPVGSSSLAWQWDEQYGGSALRVTSASGEEIYTEYLQPGTAAGPFDITGAVKQSGFSIFANYIVIGFEHILPKGLDHILFVVGLFLLSSKLKPLLWQVSSFTLAHTVTLALGMLGIVTIPAAVVEPLIALSIVYVCVENLWSRNLSKWRPAVIFGFGLLHGLGFASVLTEIGLSPNHFITGLIGFNVGVELGQLTVIALCFLAVGVWFRNKDWYRSYITNPASIAIALVAGWWVFERTVYGV
ncbi:HupE/UreJ family protein [Saccharospirillum impatiens]|uniref:HupE/UreJ family protein n=1 Tax=Saccharospirillum impatiens TaxID=169438 RepID=UPI00041D9077|nr:HupE/UreJ family protein [Saccharospirillum impatiens]